jgi:endo-1,4-beta-xylanase
MLKNTKKITCLLLCTALIGGCASTSAVSYTQSPEISSIEILPQIEPEEIDTDDDDEPEYYEDEHLINGDAIPTSIDAAEKIEEAPYPYYEDCDQPGALEYFNYDTYDYDGTGQPEEKYAVVYTPYGYEPSQSYDIFYLMHGVSGYAEIFLGSPEEPTSMKNCIDHLIEEGSINPMIIVCMTYYDHNEEEFNENEDADITKAFSQEFQNDLMPAIESSYSTYAASTNPADLIASRDHRIFGGFSMGGVTTWYAFMQSMAYCRYYLPISGMLYWGPDAGKLERDEPAWAGNMLADALAAQGYTKNDFYIYTATGGYDEAKPLLEDQIRSMEMQDSIFLFGSSSDDGYNCTYGYSEYEEHSWQAVFQYLYNALPILSRKINERSSQ